MLLTVNALSQRLQITPSTLYAWASQGKIPCRKIHGLVRFDPTEIDCWLASFSPP
jgi:excisionase family DNA binding protein